MDNGSRTLAAGLGFAAPIGCRVSGGGGMALEMGADHRIPFGLAHIGERAVAQNAGVVDQYIEASKAVDGQLHHSAGIIPIADIVSADAGASAHCLDLSNDRLGRSGVRSRTVQCAAIGVHDDGGSLGGEAKGVRPDCPGDNCDTPCESVGHNAAPPGRKSGKGGSAPRARQPICP